ASTERVENYLVGSAAVLDHVSDQCDRLAGRMKRIDRGFVDFEDRTLASVSHEEMWSVFDPPVQNRFVPMLIVRHTQCEVTLNPDQEVLEGEARIIERSYEERQR